MFFLNRVKLRKYFFKITKIFLFGQALFLNVVFINNQPKLLPYFLSLLGSFDNFLSVDVINLLLFWHKCQKPKTQTLRYKRLLCIFEILNKYNENNQSETN